LNDDPFKEEINHSILELLFNENTKKIITKCGCNSLVLVQWTSEFTQNQVKAFGVQGHFFLVVKGRFVIENAFSTLKKSFMNCLPSLN